MGKDPKSNGAAKDTASNNLPDETKYNQLETFGIFVLTIFFAGLWIWFSSRQGQQLYEYFSFAITATLVISGALKAVGRYVKPGIALGGAIVIFGAIFWLTKSLYQNDQSNKDQATIAQLQNDKKKLVDQVTGDTTNINGLDTKLADLQNQYKAILEQDIDIYTYAINENPLTNVIVDYQGANGMRVQADSDGARHTVHHPNPPLPGGPAIRVRLDPAQEPAQRAAQTSPDEDPDIGVDRIVYQIHPLRLLLYLDAKN
jgi:hypothetical protein